MNIKKLPSFIAIFLMIIVNYNFALAQDGSSELKITNIVEGAGDEAQLHSRVLVHYTGWLIDGTKFDSSVDRGEPFQFTVGAGQVIAGWDAGVGGMHIGGKRELIIPPEMGYGQRGAGDAIPGGATLKFEIELLGVQAPLYKKVALDDIVGLVADGAKIIDIRSLAEAKETGVIEGARVMPAFDDSLQFLQSFVAAFQAYVAADDVVVLIGPEGRGSLALAHVISTQGGYVNVYAAEDGMSGWVAAEMMTVPPYE